MYTIWCSHSVLVKSYYLLSVSTPCQTLLRMSEAQKQALNLLLDALLALLQAASSLSSLTNLVQFLGARASVFERCF